MTKIRITSSKVSYGWRTPSGKIEQKTIDSPPFDVDAITADRIVGQGWAERAEDSASAVSEKGTDLDIAKTPEPEPEAASEPVTGPAQESTGKSGKRR